jgi:hypothetical protein
MARLNESIEKHIEGKEDPVIQMLALINAKLDILSQQIKGLEREMNEKYEILYAGQLLLKIKIDKTKKN